MNFLQAIIIRTNRAIEAPTMTKISPVVKSGGFVID
jgi:hypothetical protein